MTGCLPSGSSVSPHRDRVNLVMHSGPLVSELRVALEGPDRSNLGAVTDRVWRYSWTLSKSQFGHALAGRDRANMDAII
jgi:hypothetical protein